MDQSKNLTRSTPLWPHGDTSLMHLVRRASQRTTACWAASIDTGLSAVQYAILVILAECEKCDQQTLGMRAGFDKATGTYVIDRMVNSGLIVTAVDAANRRRKLVTMTAEGEKVMERMATAARAAEAMFSENLSAEEVNTLKVLLTRLTGLQEQ
ncbi:MarR family transcriptional regulator [Erwiniaceae bacterium BAC15a-03b]|uniref:MarR family transcriptional regulator n=1 Tax=Winslowiella arboricola TaxID=2978220 RepID=A0A9J6PPV3_9GAMM|nr:MarR family transcriptional regulator [Winslowiella arboricola]MCU5775274.1 MarR family transcriptional regulator [Winslowiella arboricola]MCU5780329.1 MarR family transcriptional regulator [Winslowiella arboricola]